MDLNPSARSPLSLSKPFYEDITKDIPSPVSRDFYDAVSKPAEAKQAPATPARYELASPGEIAETIGAVGEAVIRTPLQIAGAAASAIRGGSRESVADKTSFLTRIIDKANQDAEEFQKKYASNRVVIAPLTKLGLPDDITTGTITRFPQQAAFSAVSAGAGLAAGLGTAAVSGPAAPIAGRAAGMAASGGVAYRMQKDNSTKDFYEKLNTTSMKTAGRELSPEEWKAAYDKNEGSLVEQGISEAIPEAIGNLVGFELFFGAAKNVFGKQLAKTTIGKTLDKYGAGAVGKMLAEQATEQTTETWTQQWQHNIDVEMGLKPGETRRSWVSFDDLRQSNKEVFADILLLSTIMGGAGLAGEHVKDKMDTKKSAQLVKDVVAENKFNTIPNEFLPAMYEHAQELSEKRPEDKDLTAARDAFATEMDKRGIDFDMTSKFKEYLKLDAEVKTEGATGEDVVRWASLRDEFKEKNISPDLYQEYLTYQSDINKAVELQRLVAKGKATEPQRKEFNRLTDAIAAKATILGLPEEVLDATGVEKGGVLRKPLEPVKSAARDVLLGDEPTAKRKNLTAKDILTEGDVNIQTEEDLTPESLAAINKKLEIAGTGGARDPMTAGQPSSATAKSSDAAGKILDITEEVKAQDKKKFDLWDTQETGTPPFVRTKVERLFAEGGEAAVLGEYGAEDTVSAYARYRLGMLEKTAPIEKAAESPTPAPEPKDETDVPDTIATPLPEAPEVKEPWQMTREEFKHWASTVTTNFNLRNAGKAVKPTQRDLEILDVERRGYINQALSEGKPIPPEVLKDYPEQQKAAREYVPEEIKAAGTSGARGPAEVHTPETILQTSHEQDLVKKVVSGDVENFRFPEHYSPMDLHTLWDDLNAAGEDFAAKNQPAIDALLKEREALKPDRSKKASARKKQIAEEIENLRAESQIITYHAGAAWEHAQEAMAEKVIAVLKERGIDTDTDTVYDAISELSDGRLNEIGWGKPLLPQLIEGVIEGQKENAIERSSSQADQEVYVGAKEFEAVREAYSGDKLSQNGTIRKPFTHDGHLRTTTAIMNDPAGGYAQTWRVTPENEYSGPTYSDKEIIDQYDSSRTRGDHTGQLITYKGKKYVLSEPLHIKVKQEAAENATVTTKASSPGEIKAAGTGGARGPKEAKEPAKTPEPKQADKPSPATAEIKAKEAEGKARTVKKYLLEHIDEAITARKAYENNKTEDAGPNHVIIDVPLDGKFVIVNDLEHLEKFKKNVSKLKVTAALNRLPQHSDKRTGKPTDQITKEAEVEVADYWKKRNEFKERYGAIPAYITAAKERLAKYQEIQRKVDAKEMTLKQLGEEAKAASKADNAGPDAWRDEWFGRTPTYRDLTDRIKAIKKEILELEDQRPALEKTIREYFPGLVKEMFEGKAPEKKASEEIEPREDIKAAGTGGARGPKEKNEITAPDSEQAEISERLRAQNEREAEFEYRKKHDNLLEANDAGKISAAEGFSLEDAKKFISGLDAAPGDDPAARAAIYAKYPELKKADEPLIPEEKLTEREDPYTAAVGKIAGKADRAKERGYEFAYGETEKGSELYWDMVGIFSGASADRLVEAGITLKKIQMEEPKADETTVKEPTEVPKTDIMQEIAEISDDELDALLDTPETETRDNATPPKSFNEAVRDAIRTRDHGFKLPPAKVAKAFDEILADVAKEGVEGAGEALKGLYELFGGSSLKSFPGGFDPDTYAKAKPHFEAALEHFIQVGKGLREFAATIVKQFGDAVRPYLKQFIQEKRDGAADAKVGEEGETPINLDENTGKGEGGARTRRKLTDQEKAEKKAKEEAAAEKKARKAAMGEFKNVGYVYDPEKLNQKTKDKSPKSAAKIILDEMVPGKIWAIEYPEGATPGVVRLNGQIQKYFRTFKEYLTESRDRLRYMSGKTIEDKIAHWITNRGGSIDIFKTWASEYGKTIQPVVDAFNGQTSITNVIGKLQDTLLPGERFGDAETGTYPRSYSEINSVEAREKFNALADILDRSRQTFYSFLTDSWHNLLADENDVLLSEINVYKRGRNKTVVRSGLPDYRESVELKKTEDFQTPFGFKGVGFGEEGWINQEERNRVIPAAFDAFKDLASTIGAPDNGMSLGGELAVQFANLGHKAKGAAAAYFPTVQTINFTRDNGDGTMAHEWGHGLHDLAAEDAKSEINSVIGTFYYVYDFDAGTRLVDDLLAKDSMFLRRMVSSKKQQRIEAVKREVEDRFEDTVRQSTDYYSTAQQMDADYTARAQEMWARAFEAYIYDTLQGKNNYLVNDFVAAGRVGGKSGVGTRLVYPSGKERETFNATIKHLLDGLVWDESGKPSLKADYVTIEKAHELMLQLQLRYLLDQVEARYKAIWTSEPSKDGFFWYRYDETSFGPMMQPDGYDGYDKAFTSEGQNGTGAVAYLTQLHPDAILDYKLSNIQYEGENPTYIAKERGGINGSISEDGTEPLEEVSAESDRSPDEGGEIRSGDRGSGANGEGGTREYGKQRGATGSSEGDSAEGIHPSPAGNYRITDPTLNDPKSVPVRFGLNLSAVKVLNLVESENRTPTDAEKDILAQYSGWGGMSELFAYEPSAAWAGKAELLKVELTEEEMRDAASSSTSAYYTPVPIGQFMWKLSQRLGFENGVVLDPATGANGLFLGTMPMDLAQGVALQGVEMDTLSARIASKLYGLAAIENKAFQDVKKPNNRFDMTITNVPFERITPTDLKHNKGGHSLHNYFINKMLNLTAPGALSMMITTSNTLDSIGTHLTEFAEKAHFVGAIRLPSGIYSSTNVATDILVFRKKIEGGKFVGIPAEEWTAVGIDNSTGLEINNYFLQHPEMVAGKLEKITGRYGNEQLRVAPEGDLQSNLERIASAFPDKVVEREAVKEAKSIDDIISAPGTVKEGGAYINDKDEVCEKLDGEEVKLPIATASEQKKAEIVRGYVNLLDQVRATLRVQRTETDDAVAKAEQTKLKKLYDQFVNKFGPVNNPKNSSVFNDYTDSSWVIALEEYDPDTGKVTKIADIFTKNITGIASRPDRADTDHDALAMALDEFGYPNLEYMARLRNSDVESVRQGVADKIVENPETGFLETMDEYLSGNVKRKLAVARDMAQSNPEYARNVSLLEAAQPAEIPQHRITARIGASWISPEHLAEFVKEKMGLRHGLHAIFNFSPVSNEWSMSFAGEERYRGRGKGFSENKAEVQRQIAAAKRSIEATTVWGTERMDFFELLKCALQGKRPQVTYTVDRKQYLDEVATQAAEVKLQDIQTEFGRWLFADTFRADQAVKRFNDLINTSVPMKADGSHLTFPGKSMWMITPKEKENLGITDTLTFYPHQMNATWKYLKSGNLYLGHEVGTGKTVTMALIAMEAKRLRGKKKVLYVTLNDSTMGQAVQEIKNLYPMANVLPVRVSTNEQRKQRSLQKIALNDFDVAIMRQQDLDRIGLSPESERVFIEEEIQELREILEEAKREGARILEQDIQVQLHALEEKLKAPSVYDEAKKKNLFFDDLGIDLMIVDEAHKYKNIPYATRLTRITGLNPVGSPTAKDFFRKTQYLNAQFPKKDAIVLASGTALSNSIAEMYNIQRMLQPQEVKRQGVWSFDRWIANYGDMGSQMEWDGARGQYRVITTNRRIVNAGRLLATAYQNVDSVRADDTPVKRPIIRGGEPQRVKVQPNQYVEDYKKIVLDRCAEIESDPKNAQYEGVPDNMLRIISNMSKVAIDQRLDHHYANTEMQQDSKIAAALQIMYRRWQEEAKHKGVQLVFADLGIPGKYSDKFKYKTEDEIARLSPEELTIYNEEKFEHESASTGFNTYEGLKKELVKLGIPENQIAFIHDADHTNKEKKAANLRSLFKKVNAGDIRVLIGSTSKAGTGVNIQGRVSDVHHLDVWWNFSAWEQRNGRGIRAGNLYANDGMPGTYIWNYVTETTVDATRWDKVFAKGKVLNAVLGGDINLDVIEDISDETMSAKMMAAEASGDPLMSIQATLLQQVQGLRFEQAAHLDVVRRSKMDLAAIPGRIEALEKRIEDYQHSRDIMDKVTAVRFIGDDRTLVLEKHGKEIAEALEKAVMEDTGSWTENKKAPLLVFGSHKETEAIEKVAVKGGEQKEKKVKKYTFTPLPAKADITGKSADPYGRRLLISGDIISSDRNLADIKIDKGKKASVDVKANVSRTVTEFLTWLNSNEKSAKDTIAELKSNEPKLQQVIDTPWAKVDDLAAKDKELHQVEAQMAARGVFVGDPTTGIPIDKYKSIVPMLEDVADKDEWSMYNGVVYPHQNPVIGVRGKTDLSRFLKSGKLKPNIATSYNAPDSLQALNGEKPNTPATKPAAYTVIDNVTKFWVPAGTTYVTVDPVQWNLLQRIVGQEGSWHYDDKGMGERYIVHVDAKGERDAFIWAKQASRVPQGVKDIGEKAASPSTGKTQYSAGRKGERTSGALDLETIQSLFPGQAVSQDGDNFTVILKNGGQATIYGVSEITPDAVSLNAGYKKGVGKGQFIAGAFGGLDTQGRGIIRIVRDNANAPWTISHESVHWLEKLGIISEMDKATLNARIQKERKWSKYLSPEENRANWLADFVKGPKPNQAILAQIWQKIQDFINRLVGIRTAGMIGRELQSGKIFERVGRGTEKGITIFEPVPVFTVTEKGLKKRPRRVENPVATRAEAEQRIPPAGGRVLNFVPKTGTLPAVKSEPIGTWESSRRKIAGPEDAAVIARDNLFRDAQEFFVTIVTNKDGDILAVNQHTIGAPNQSQVFSYVVAGQILNVDGAARVWLVHNHPSGTADVSQADLNVSSHIGDLVADAGIDSMPIIAIAPSSYSNGETVKPLPPKEPAIHKMPLLGRKFDQLPEGLGSITDENALSDFGRLYLKEGGMIMLSAQRQPVAVVAIDDYSKLRPLHTEILREAEKRNAVDFMIYDVEKTLTHADIDNLVSFAKNTALDFTTVLDRSGDRYSEIEGLVKSAKRSIAERTFYSTQADAIDSSVVKAYDEALSAHAYISPRVKPSLSAEEKTIRENAYGVKGMDPAVLDNVAKEMAALIPNEARKSAILVPIPGHTGETTANVALAERIAAITGGIVADVLKRESGPSQRDARVAGQRTMKPDEFGMVSTEMLDGEHVFFVDNVISSGATIRAARDAVGGGKGLVYAKSNPKGEKYAVGTADPELPKWIGDKVKRAFKKDSVASILLDFEPIQAGPLDGGCLVVARALRRIEPTGKIITIEGHQKDGTWQAEHYGFELNGVMIDGAGHAPSREVWAKRFAKNENLDRPYRITEGQVESDDIVQDVRTEKKLAAALEKELTPDESYSIGKYDNFGDTAVTDFSKDNEWHDIAYREPTKEVITRLNAWLNENPYATVRMYHGTDAGIPVMKEGLKPTSARTAKSLQSSHGTVSLSLFPGMAHQFGRLAYPGKKIAVYPVDVLVKNLIPDTDQLRNKRHFGGRTDLGDTLAESIAIGHGAKVKGKVSVDWIRLNEEQYSIQTDPIDNTSIFPEVNERLKAAKGVKYASLKDRAKDALVTGWEHFTRHFQHLDPGTDGAVIDVFRKFQDVPAWAKDETVRQLSGFVGRLSPQGRDVFTMNILLPDLIRDIESGTLGVEDDAELPFGYKNRDQVKQDYDHFKAIAEGSPAITEAIEKRNAFMTSLTDQLIQHKLLQKEVANDPAAYFHHQVLAYMNYKENPNWGMSSRDVRTHRKGWQVGRKGSQLDYNTEYVESEFEIISQALTQIETVKSLKEIERLADIKPKLEVEAKDQNMATFMRKIDETGRPLADPLLPFRTKIAMGFQRLAKLFTTENDIGALPMEFDDVVEHIVDQEEQRRAAKEDEIEFDPVPHPRMFALLNYLINHEGPGSMPAAMIFKTIAARNAFIKQVVGKDWVTYRDMIPEGYVAHKPETGSTFYFTNSIADQALTQVLAGNKNLPDAVRQVLARGRDEEWVVKEGISKTLNEFRPAMSDSLPAKMSKGMLTAWKQWILMNPFRVIKYNLNNMSGDLDIAMAYDPKIITGYFAQAFKDLWAASEGNASEALMDELSDLTKRGVVGSGMTAMDIPELGDVKSVKGLVDFFDGTSKGALSKWWTMSKRLSTLRENILRLAANRYFLDRLGRGEIVYGASRKEEVDAVTNKEDKAAKLARELVGDYGNISHAGQYIRERMIPFYSWLEINAPRYVRLFRNLKHEGGGGIGALGGVMAWKATKLAIKASALMGLVMLWNAAFFPDEEDDLQEAGREQLHMILGRRTDGSIITIRFQGALTDALSWFGMANPVEQAKKVVNGTKRVGDVAKDVVKAAPLRLFQGFRPEPKLLYETLSGQSFFPDPMHPRPIRDTTEHILRTFSLDRIYNQASGKPKQGGTWATQLYRDIQSLALTEADPGEQAYYTSRKYIFDWLDKQGKEKPVAMPTNRSNSLYYYKQALKFGDFDAAQKYLKKYQDMGGKLHDVQGSIRRVHPLASLRLADRYKFKASLSPEQQETLSVATAWYKKHYVDSYREQRAGLNAAPNTQ